MKFVKEIKRQKKQKKKGIDSNKRKKDQEKERNSRENQCKTSVNEMKQRKRRVAADGKAEKVNEESSKEEMDEYPEKHRAKLNNNDIKNNPERMMRQDE